MRRQDLERINTRRQEEGLDVFAAFPEPAEHATTSGTAQAKGQEYNPRGQGRFVHTPDSHAVSGGHHPLAGDGSKLSSR